MQTELFRYIGGVIRDERGALLEIGGTADHIHILARFRADASVAEMLRRIKAHSSKWLGERRDLRAWYGWQTGYAAFSVSESNVSSVRQYFQNQEAHHMKMTFEEEFVALLEKHGIAYDARYLGT